MNTSHHISNQNELEQLIERYFDGETSIQEEQLLREALANSQWTSETIDEARFAMGYFTTHRQERKEASKFNRSSIIGIAATIAILLTVGIPALSHRWSTPQPEYIAYVNGKVIANNQEAVMSLIEQDLNNMGMATHEMDNAIADDMNDISDATHYMTNELSSLGEAIELDD